MWKKWKIWIKLNWKWIKWIEWMLWSEWIQFTLSSLWMNGRVSLWSEWIDHSNSSLWVHFHFKTLLAIKLSCILCILPGARTWPCHQWVFSCSREKLLQRLHWSLNKWRGWLVNLHLHQQRPSELRKVAKGPETKESEPADTENKQNTWQLLGKTKTERMTSIKADRSNKSQITMYKTI